MRSLSRWAALHLRRALAAGLTLLGAAVSAAGGRERLSFNEGWRFLRTDDAPWTASQLDYAVLKPFLLAASADLLGPLAEKPARPSPALGREVEQTLLGFDDSTWRPLSLPHDWGIEGKMLQENPGETGKLTWWGTGWYRKRFSVPASDTGRRVTLEIDGAMAYSAVWLNGHLIGGWPYGYTSYVLDLTPHLNFGGENVIAIRLDNPPGSSRWYPGSGLYRNVWLTKTQSVRVSQWGTGVTTPSVSPEAADVLVTVRTTNGTPLPVKAMIGSEIFLRNPDGTPGEAVARHDPAEVVIPGGQEASQSQSFDLARPRLWSVGHPNLYIAVTTVSVEGQTVDRYETVFGVRAAVFDAKRGFLLNGQRVPIQGVCLHHDLGSLGTAISRRALQRQLELLRDMGCNAIRTAHNPPAPELLDLCDEMGFLVMDEVFDCWTKGKTRNDYHQLFADWHERDLRAFVRRDRNHPSVILWSIGNEVQDQHDAEGWKVGARLAGILREEDRSRPVIMGLDGVQSGYNGLQNVLDVMGYNYKPWEYVKFHAAFPSIPIMGSETASTISSRGEYFFPVSDDKLDKGSRVNFQINSYDLSAESWSTPPEVEWAGQEAGPFVAGEFVWTGFDYLGESSPYLLDSTVPLNFTDPTLKEKAERELRELGKILVPSRSSYFGILDLAGFPKDRYYLYQARWRPDFPMAHLLPHWSWPGREGQVTPVHVYTTGDEAELFVNGKSLGRKKKGGASRLRWDDVTYSPGEVRVVAYRDGKVWAEAKQRTPGPAAKLVLTADRMKLKGDGVDLAFVTVDVVDADGTRIPRAKDLLQFSVEGPARIVAVDNGDPTSHEPFQATQRRAFNGKALVVLRVDPGASGQITLRAEADGLAAGSVSAAVAP